tara:strand:+ start:847 stop:1617 length:771 start_codon:yes stop_codon:yes gene_type:complete
MQKIDLLDEDPAIAGQKYVCVSFISPENIIKKKEIFFFERFLKTYDFEKNNSKYTKFLQYIGYKHDIDMNLLIEDYNEFLKLESEKLKESSLTLLDEYKNYMDKYEESLQKEFDEQNEFKTNTRGLKIRGSFDTEELANNHAKKVRENDANHNVYVGPVGIWIPWDPEAYKTGNVMYMEDDLQKLMAEKQKNELEAKEHFNQRIKEAKENAIKENIEKAKKSGNKLTQQLNENNELTGANTQYQEEVELLNKNITL